MNVEDILRRFSGGGLSLTQPRRAVVEAITRCPNSFSAAEVEAQVATYAPDVGRATIFRTLELLERLGIVSHIHAPGGCTSYVLCRQDSHHHHLICSKCGAVTDMEECGLGETLHDAAARYGFRVEGHLLEIYGVCPSCSISHGTERSELAPSRSGVQPRC